MTIHEDNLVVLTELGFPIEESSENDTGGFVKYWGNKDAVLYISKWKTVEGKLFHYMKSFLRSEIEDANFDIVKASEKEMDEELDKVIEDASKTP